MARTVPKLDLAPVKVKKIRATTLVDEELSSTGVVCFTPETLESAFDPLPLQASAEYRKKLQEMKEGSDYLVLYRLSSEGNLVKVVRRHPFGPIKLDQVSRYHQSIPLRQKVHILDQSLDLKADQKHSTSHRKNSFYQDTKDFSTSGQTFESQSLMAAKRILSTTLSLEYGPKHRKIRANSTVGEFVEYYKHRYQHRVPVRGGGEGGAGGAKKGKGLQTAIAGNSEQLQLKFVKTTKRLGRLLGNIEAVRGDVLSKIRKSASVSTLAKSFTNVTKSASKRVTSKMKSIPPSSPSQPTRVLTFSDLDDAIQPEPQQSFFGLQISREKLHKQIAEEMLRIAARRRNVKPEHRSEL